MSPLILPSLLRIVHAIVRRCGWFIAGMFAAFGAYGQVTLVSVPPAALDTLRVLKGSEVMFRNTTNAENYAAFGTTEFQWQLPDGDSGSGPHVRPFDSVGLFTISLEIITGGQLLGRDSLVVMVLDDSLSFEVDLDPGNACTVEHPLTGVFQTQSNVSCTCNPEPGFAQGPGPAIALLHTNTFPVGTAVTCYWGGAGNSANAAPVTTYTGGAGGFPTAATSVSVFPGQQPVAGTNGGHYQALGSYNLVVVWTSPSGQVFSEHRIMSWGNGQVDLCSNSSLTTCAPLGYSLCFDAQFPGTSYIVDWGDGGVDTLQYPHIPLYPNSFVHPYEPSCVGTTLNSYQITIKAYNDCSQEYPSINTIGPFVVNELPAAGFEATEVAADNSGLLCQTEFVHLVDTTVSGYFVNFDGVCSDEYTAHWSIEPASGEGTSWSAWADPLLTDTLEVPFTATFPDSAQSEFFLAFHEPGLYQVALNASNAGCGSDVQVQTFTVAPIARLNNDALTVCSGEQVNYTPVANAANEVLPPGTTFTWTATVPSGISGVASSGAGPLAIAPINTTGAPAYIVFEFTPLSGFCPGPAFTFTLQVAAAVIIPDAALTVCSGAAFNAVPMAGALIPGGTTVVWNLVNATNNSASLPSSQPPCVGTVTALAPGLPSSALYRGIGSAGNGCIPDTFLVEVQVNSLAPPEIAAVAPICPGGNVAQLELTNTPAAAGTVGYVWQSTGAAGIWSSLATPNGPAATVTNVTPTTLYRLQLSSTLNNVQCIETSDPLSIPLIAFTAADIGAPQTVCAGEMPAALSITAAASGNGAFSYQWQSKAAAGNWTILPNETGTTYAPPSLPRLYRLLTTLTHGGGACTSASDTVEIAVNASAAGPTTPHTTVCLGELPGPFGATLTLEGATLLFHVWESAPNPTGPWSPVPGASGGAYIPNQPLAATTYFRRTSTVFENGATCVLTSAPASAVLNSVDIVIQPIADTLCAGGDAEAFVAGAAGSGVLTWQWQQANNATGPWTTVPGISGATFDPAPGSIAASTWFRARANSTLNGLTCSALSDSVAVVLNAVVAGAVGPDQTLCPGVPPVALAYTSGGSTSGVASYVWQSGPTAAGPWTPIAGATGSSYAPPSDLTSTAYFQPVLASTLGTSVCTAAATPASLVIVQQPTLSLVPPADLEICAGGSLTAPLQAFALGGAGTPSYAWFLDGAVIPGANNSSYLPPNFLTPGTYAFSAQTTLAGSGCATAVAAPLTVTVYPAPAIASPVSAAYCAGASAVEPLVATAAGGSGESFSYQWFTGPPPGSAVVGATGPVWVPNTTSAGTTTYFAAASQPHPNCSVSSSSATVVVHSGASFTSQPASQSICEGGSFAPSTVAFVNGSAGATYQWFSGSTPNTPGTAISGAQSATHLPVSTAAGTSYLYATVSFPPESGCPTLTSAAAQLVTAPDPSAISSPPDLSVCVGGGLPAPLQAGFAGGAGGVTYGWSVNGGSISGANTASYAPPPYSAPGAYTYIATATFSGSGCDAASSAPATVTAVADPVVPALVGATYCVGGASAAVPLAVVVSGGLGTTSYQWYASAPPSAPPVAIPGATGASYTPPLAATGSVAYSVIASQTGPNCSVASAPATVTAAPLPTFSALPASATVCVGAPVTPLNVAVANGLGSPSYQWFSSSTSGTGGSAIPGATAANFTPSSAMPGTTYYSATATFPPATGCPAVSSPAAFISVNGVEVADVAASQHVCSGEAPAGLAPLLSPTGSGTLSYTWQTSTGGGFAAIPGASNVTYTPPMLTNAGTAPTDVLYRLRVTSTLNGVGCSDTSPPATVTVHPLPSATAPQAAVCDGAAAAVVWVSNLSYTGSTFVWSAAPQAAVEGESTALQAGDVIADVLDNLTTTPQWVTYTGTATSTFGCTGPLGIATVQVVPAVFMQPTTVPPICSGSVVNAVLNANVPASFDWLATVNNPGVSGESLIPVTGSTLSDALANSSGVDQLIIYSVTPTSLAGTCTGATSAISVVVKPPIAFLNAGPMTLCSGEEVGLELETNTEASISWIALSNPAVQGESTGLQTTSALNDALVVPGTAPATVTYSLVALSPDDGCASPVTSLEVLVLPVPVVNPVEDWAVCSGELVPAVTLTGPVVGAEYAWTAESTLDVAPPAEGVGAVPAFFASNTGAFEEVIEVTTFATLELNGTVCAGPAESYTVTVNPTPAAYPLPDLTTCEGTVVSGIAPAGPVPGTTWVWEFSAPQLGLLPEGTGNIPTFSASNPSLVPDSGVVTVVPIFAAGGAACAGIPTDFTLTVLPAPTVGPTSSEVCSGEPVELSLNSDLASTYAWFAIPQPNVLGETSFPIQSGSQISQILATDALFAQTVNYQVVATDILNGCSSPPTAIPVTVHPLPLLGFTVLNSSTCELNPIYFSNNSPGTLTYLWDFGDGTTSVADDPVHAYPGPGEYVVELTGSNPLTGCTNSISEELEIGVVPDATFLVSDSSGCGLTEVEFLAVTQDSALVYLWDFGDGSQSTQIGSAGNQFAPTGCFDVTLTLTDGTGCVGVYGIEEAVCAFPIPNAEFNASPYTTTTLDPEIEFTNGSTFATSYFWEFGDGNTSYDPDPVHVYQGFGTFQVKLTASNGTECIDEARASIVVNPDLGIYVPNAFTPGTLGPQSNDGINDAFKPVISDPSLLVFYHFQIFDRWGNVIWESYDPDAWWTGGVDPGNDYYVNNDLYEWRLHVKTTWSDNDIISFGHVTVVK